MSSIALVIIIGFVFTQLAILMAAQKIADAIKSASERE